nr:hypothetical protein Iba_chr10dCG11390 [Ipomoea batatas]
MSVPTQQLRCSKPWRRSETGRGSHTYLLCLALMIGLSFAFPFSIHREQAKCSNGGEVQRRLQQQAPAGMVNSGEQSRWLWLLQPRLASRLLVIVVPRPAACDEQSSDWPLLSLTAARNGIRRPSLYNGGLRRS